MASSGRTQISRGSRAAHGGGRAPFFTDAVTGGGSLSHPGAGAPVEPCPSARRVSIRMSGTCRSTCARLTIAAARGKGGREERRAMKIPVKEPCGPS